MDSIAIRYARALYSFARETKKEVLVYEEMKLISQIMQHMPELLAVLNNPAIEIKNKKDLMLNAAGKKPSAEYIRFIELLIKNMRLDQIQWIALMYLEIYRKEKNIHEALLTVADDIDPEIQNQIFIWMEKALGGIVEMKVETDPHLIGGFILEADGKRWDSSLKTQLRKIHQELINR